MLSSRYRDELELDLLYLLLLAGDLDLDLDLDLARLRSGVRDLLRGGDLLRSPPNLLGGLRLQPPRLGGLRLFPIGGLGRGANINNAVTSWPSI